MIETPSDNSISINIKKHKVVVVEETVIYIHCPKRCKKPCTFEKDIIDYLKAELFIKEGYIVSNGK